jgi:glutamine amidotransferase
VLERPSHGEDSSLDERPHLIALIDYGAGNLASVRKGFAAAGAELFTPHHPSELEPADGIVVPGVGNFAATAALESDWREAIVRRIEAGVPLLGICLGMQWLFEESEEAPPVRGLGALEGRCTRLSAAPPLKVPHVGWNRLTLAGQDACHILRGIDDGAYVYFTHSYAAPVTRWCRASTWHGGPFAAAVQREHVAGVQFHPEKSGSAGLRILQNFVAMTRGER